LQVRTGIAPGETFIPPRVQPASLALFGNPAYFLMAINKHHLLRNATYNSEFSDYLLSGSYSSGLWRALSLPATILFARKTFSGLKEDKEPGTNTLAVIMLTNKGVAQGESEFFNYSRSRLICQGKDIFFLLAQDDQTHKASLNNAQLQNRRTL
jgi:hypothetical protein